MRAARGRPGLRPLRGARRAAVTVAVGTGAALLAAGGCSPRHDWREIRAETAPATLLMPCRPDRLQRSVSVAGAPVRLSLLACSAGGQTWALAHADVGDPTRVAAALGALRASAAANVAAASEQVVPLQVSGATPSAAAVRVRLVGRRPDGRPLQEELAVFAHGTHVFQATVLGDTLPGDAVEVFFEGLRVGR